MLVAGVDEVGRGPLAGRVVAAAVILPEDYALPGLTDSKKLSAIKRQKLYKQIQACAIAWAVGACTVEEIDRINIFQASLLAMARAVRQLNVQPELVLVDGRHTPALTIPCRAVIKGDSSVPAISAASIIAKETRDAEMRQAETEYPGYGFAQHKAYPTKQHIMALQKLGPCSIHRRSFGPVKAMFKMAEAQHD